MNGNCETTKNKQNFRTVHTLLMCCFDADALWICRFDIIFVILYTVVCTENAEDAVNNRIKSTRAHFAKIQ